MNHIPKHPRRPLALAGALSLLVAALQAAPASAATLIADGTTCTLVNAINAANTDTATGRCPAGSGADTIVIPPNTMDGGAGTDKCGLAGSRATASYANCESK